MKVELTYFKDSGKYYSAGHCELDDSLQLYEIFDAVAAMHRQGKLPDLVDGARYITHVDVPNHPFRHPALIGLPTVTFEEEEPSKEEEPTPFDLTHELEVRNLSQRLLGAWLYQAIYLTTGSSTNVHATFSIDELHQVAVRELYAADKISKEMVDPMIAQRSTLGILKRADMMITALHVTGHVEQTEREGVWYLTTHGVRELFARTTRDARLAFALEIRRQYDKRHQY